MYTIIQTSVFSHLKQIQEFHISRKLPEIYTFNYLFDKSEVSHEHKPKRSKIVSGLVLKNKIPIP